MTIYCKLGNGTTFKAATKVNEAAAEALKARFEREDRYSVEVEKYQMPKAWEGQFPTYEIKRR